MSKARTRKVNGAAARYGAQHQALRRQAARRIDRDRGFTCWRCGRWIPIDPADPNRGQRWDLGHVDGTDEYAGPECILCNRGSAARRGNRMRARRRRLVL